MNGQASTTLTIEGPLCIYTAVDNKLRLMEALHRSAALEVDLSRVDEFDSAGFQLLVLVRREGLRLGRAVRLCGHSAAVRDVLVFFNFDAYFGEPMVLPAWQGQ